MERASLRSHCAAYGRCTTLRSSKVMRHCSGYGYKRRRSCFACSQSAPHGIPLVWRSNQTQTPAFLAGKGPGCVLGESGLEQA